MSFAEEHHKDTIITVKNVANGKEISWDMLWTIFRPNTLLYTKHDSVEAGQVVRLVNCKPLAMSYLQAVLEIGSAWAASRSEADVPKLREGIKEQAYMYAPAKLIVELATGRTGWRVLLVIFLMRILSLLNAKQRN